MTVRLFGIYRLKSGISRLTLDIGQGADLFSALNAKFNDIDEKEWEKSVLYLNGKLTPLNKFKKTKLNSEDEILLMSPVSGG